MSEETCTSNSPPDKGHTLSLDMARTFVAVHDTGSFRRAADRVHRSPSAISLQITKLETQLGQTLFLRDARRVEMTESGAVLLSYARRMLALNDELHARFRGSALQGFVRLAAPHDLGASVVPDLLKRFAQQYPRVQVDVRLESSRAIQNAFAGRGVDVAVFSETDDTVHNATELYAEPLVWLGARDGSAAHQHPVPIAIADSGCSWREAAVAALESKGTRYRVAYSSDTSMGQRAAVRADLAIAALPQTLIDAEIAPVPGDLDLPVVGLHRLFLSCVDNEYAEALSRYLEERLGRPGHTVF